MKILHTRKDIEDSYLPSFVSQTAYCLLDVYKTENLDKFGGVYWIESEDELVSYEEKVVEYVEIIITEDGKVWHGAFVFNDDYSTDVYVRDCFMTPKLRKEWEANLIRTVDENEFQ